MRDYLYEKKTKERGYTLVKGIPLNIRKDEEGILAEVKSTNVLAFGKNMEEATDSLMTMCVKLLRIYHSSDDKLLGKRDLKKKKILEEYFEKIE